MKYNVKQAVSGIQDKMDQGAKNKVLAQALGGLASGIGAGVQMDINRNQVANIDKTLSGQMGYFEDLAKSGDKFEKLIANENLLKLGMLKANLNPSNIGSFGQTYKDLFTGGSLFEPLAGIERAKLIAQGYAGKQQAIDDQTAAIRGLVNPYSNVPGANPLQGMFNAAGGLFSQFGQGADPGLSTDYNFDY